MGSLMPQNRNLGPGREGGVQKNDPDRPTLGSQDVVRKVCMSQSHSRETPGMGLLASC